MGAPAWGQTLEPLFTITSLSIPHAYCLLPGPCRLIIASRLPPVYIACCLTMIVEIQNPLPTVAAQDPHCRLVDPHASSLPYNL